MSLLCALSFVTAVRAAALPPGDVDPLISQIVAVKTAAKGYEAVAKNAGKTTEELAQAGAVKAGMVGVNAEASALQAEANGWQARQVGNILLGGGFLTPTKMPPKAVESGPSADFLAAQFAAKYPVKASAPPPMKPIDVELLKDELLVRVAEPYPVPKIVPVALPSVPATPPCCTQESCGSGMFCFQCSCKTLPAPAPAALETCPDGFYMSLGTCKLMPPPAPAPAPPVVLGCEATGCPDNFFCYEKSCKPLPAPAPPTSVGCLSTGCPDGSFCYENSCKSLPAAPVSVPVALPPATGCYGISNPDMRAECQKIGDGPNKDAVKEVTSFSPGVAGTYTALPPPSYTASSSSPIQDILDNLKRSTDPVPDAKSVKDFSPSSSSSTTSSTVSLGCAISGCPNGFFCYDGSCKPLPAAAAAPSLSISSSSSSSSSSTPANCIGISDPVLKIQCQSVGIGAPSKEDVTKREVSPSSNRRNAEAAAETAAEAAAEAASTAAEASLAL